MGDLTRLRSIYLGGNGFTGCIPVVLWDEAIRRRLNAAATALGKRLEFRRAENAVYFWPSDGRRRGRPRKNPDA